MNKKFKSINFILAMSIIFTSCSNKVSTNSNGINDEIVTPKGEFPIVKEKTEIVITTKSNSNVNSYEYGENAYTTWLADTAGVDIKFNLLPEADAVQKLNIELASNGNLGDLIINFDFDIPMMMTYGSEGVLAPLQDYITAYGDNIAKAFEVTDGARELTQAPDGNIYALPYVGNCYNCVRQQRFWINSEFLNKLNMEMPTTTDELYNYLVSVKNTDLNGNGQADEIPMTGSTNDNVWVASPLHFLMNSFTIKDQNDYYVKDDIVHAAYAEDGWREGLKWMNKLYSEGLIDPSTFTNDGNQLKTLVALEDGMTVGAVSAGGPHILAQASDADIRERYIAVPPLKGPSGLQFAQYQMFGQISVYRSAIPAKSDKKEVAFRLLDLMYSEESWMRGRYGEPEIDWEVPEEGIIASNGGQAKIREINSLWGSPTNKHWQMTATWAHIFSDSMEAKPEGVFDTEKVLYQAAKEYDKYAINCELPNMFFEGDLMSQVNEWKTNLKTFSKTASAEFITGIRNPNDDNDWNEYLKELEEQGLSKFLNSNQEAFDKTWKGKYPYEHEDK